LPELSATNISGINRPRYDPPLLVAV